MNKKDLQENLDNPDYFIVDIREGFELKQQPKIDTTHHIPMNTLLEQATAHNLPQDKQIITICRSGGRCQMITAELRNLGYNADYLEGGMIAWDAQ